MFHVRTHHGGTIVTTHHPFRSSKNAGFGTFCDHPSCLGRWDHPGAGCTNPSDCSSTVQIWVKPDPEQGLARLANAARSCSVKRKSRHPPPPALQLLERMA